MSLSFLLTSFAVVVSPGTGVVYTLATGLERGFRASVVAAFGCTLGIIPQLAATAAGLAAIMRASALAFQALKYLGVAYLLYLAWQAQREDGALKLDISEDRSRASSTRIVGTAIVINVLNPKLSMFFLAFLPQFIPAGAPDFLPRMLTLSAVFMAMTFVVFVIYGASAAVVRDRVISRPRVLRWMRRGFAAAFVGLGVRLAVASR